VTRHDQHDSEPHAWARLLAADGIGLVTARRLVSDFGSASSACSASTDHLRSTLGCSLAAARRFRQAIRRVDLAREFAWLTAHGGALVPIEHEHYPKSLIPLPDPPGVLRVQGRLPDDDQPHVALVGTRRCTAYGLRQAGRITQGLAEAGCCIVSGGARGIDAEVHRMALRCKARTMVVLGSGLARRYPPEHDELFDRVVDAGGAILSEVAVHQPPRPGLFPRRNRIISGLSLGVVVIEAPERSGAMVTARLAVEEHGRDAMVVPGPADSLHHAGGHRAIQQGWAQLVMSADEVVAVLLQHHEAAEQLMQSGGTQ
jgi:DNA processing protein